jgi:hypothetical protein
MNAAHDTRTDAIDGLRETIHEMIDRIGVSEAVGV